MENVIVVTTVDGLGIVEAKNDLAHFTFSLRSKGETLEAAQTQVEEKSSQALKMLENFKANKGLNLLDGIKTSLANYKLEHREGTEKYPAGFQSINTISFTMTIDSNLDEVFRACLKFDSNMSMPYFSIKDRDVLLEQAIVQASTDAKDKLAKECKLLNVDPASLKIQNWNFGYEGYLPNNLALNNFYTNGVRGATGPTGPQGATGTMGATGPSYSPVVTKIGTTYQELLDAKLSPGSIEVRVAVRVNYIWAKE